MRHVPLLVLLALPTALAGATLPSYWEADGMASWTLTEGSPSNHGGSMTSTACGGTVDLSAYGPAIRQASAAGATLTLGRAEEHDQYDVRIDILPDAAPGCDARTLRFWSTYDPMDLLDASIGCQEDLCTRVTLAWSEDGVGTLRIERGLSFQLEAAIGTTFTV